MAINAATTRAATRTTRALSISRSGSRRRRPGIRPNWSVFSVKKRTDMNRTEDRRLIARLQAREDGAMQELAERYGSRIYQLALRQMKNREDAEEVTQDVQMKVYRKIGAFRGD